MELKKITNRTLHLHCYEDSVIDKIQNFILNLSAEELSQVNMSEEAHTYWGKESEKVEEIKDISTDKRQLLKD
jgi:hypothetical protein